MVETAYLDALSIQRCATIIKKTRRKLCRKQFDTIVFRGMSGALVAPQLAVQMKKEMVLIRHRRAGCHSSVAVEGYKNPEKYIIVDDFKDSGRTIRLCVKRMKKWAPDAECIGVYQYKFHRFDTLQELFDE